MAAWAKYPRRLVWLLRTRPFLCRARSCIQETVQETSTCEALAGKANSIARCRTVCNSPGSDLHLPEGASALFNRLIKRKRPTGRYRDETDRSARSGHWSEHGRIACSQDTDRFL